VHSWQSRTRMQIRTGTLQDKEKFDLDVSDSEDDHESLHSDHGCNANSTSQGENSRNHINDPNIVFSFKTTTNDIHHFFNKSEDKVVCKICRHIFLQLLKKLSQCLAVLKRLTYGKSNKLHNNLKIIYVILGHLGTQTNPISCDLV
jgi:hypothetical protein